MSENTESTGQPLTMAQKAKGRKKEALWLISFTDLTLILMCFFALMLSFSTFSPRKFENVKEGMAKKSSVVKEANLRTIYESLQKVVVKNKLQNSVQVSYDNNGTVVEFKDNMLFASGSAESNPEFKRVTDIIMNAIAVAPPKYNLIIEGHTDDLPYRGKEFKSNWELSAARGFVMLRDFNGKGVSEKRMSVIALAHTKPKVSIDNKKDKALQDARAANRRVVIRIE